VAFAVNRNLICPAAILIHTAATVKAITSDVHRLRPCAAAFDPEIGTVDADPATSMRRAHEVLTELAPGTS